jgi:hypothetical protein
VDFKKLSNKVSSVCRELYRLFCNNVPLISVYHLFQEKDTVMAVDIFLLYG